MSDLIRCRTRSLNKFNYSKPGGADMISDLAHRSFSDYAIATPSRPKNPLQKESP